MKQLPAASTPFKAVFYIARYLNRRDITNVSDGILKFKKGTEPQCSECIEITLNEFKKFNLRVDYIFRALGNDELKLDENKPLHKLGIRLANTLNARFIPEIISKSECTIPFRDVPKWQRIEIIKDAYQVDENLVKALRGSILFIDDITTSGATANGLMQKILAINKGLIAYQFAFAKSGGYSNENVGGITLSDPPPPTPEETRKLIEELEKDDEMFRLK